jgi:hypothetical protein
MAGNNIHITVDENRVVVQEGQTQIVEVISQGPQGAIGPQGPVGPSGSVQAVGLSGSLQFAWHDGDVSGSSQLVFDPVIETLTLSGSFLLSGSILPDSDPITGLSSFSLGSPTNAWKDLYVGDSTIYFLTQSIIHPLTITTTEDDVFTLSIDGNLVALQDFTHRITSGSVTASVNVDGDIFLIQSASVDMFKVNSEGVTVLKTNIETPTPVEGGIFYSGSGDFFFGS